jgi:hypothetical protein
MSGANRGKELNVFSKLDTFLATKPNIEPLLVVDTKILIRMTATSQRKQTMWLKVGFWFLHFRNIFLSIFLSIKIYKKDVT